jgi:uncharacterized membrane protein (DUF106 family)
MDTLLLLQNTVTASLKVIHSCQPCIHEAKTNSNDAAIVFFICVAVVLSILIIAITIGFSVWYYNRITKEHKKLQETCVKSEELSKKVEELKFIKDLKGTIDNLSKTDKEKKQHEIACEILEKISSLARPKDGTTDEEIATKLFELYKKIKNELN